MSNFMTGGIVTAFLLITCFPIWPQIMKVILWYISCTLLVLIFSLVLIRWFLFLFVWIFGFEFWILPNLFDEERSVMDSFKPAMSFEKTGPGQLWWRMAVLIGFVGSFYWAYTQPTEFDEFLKSNKQFVDDLYDGNLLSDMSQWVKKNTYTHTHNKQKQYIIHAHHNHNIMVCHSLSLLPPTTLSL
jgi:translocation protein SEC62